MREDDSKRDRGVLVTQSAGPASAGVNIDRINAAVELVLETTAALSDEQVSEASGLPGWSRGHVLTHIARNADGLRNLLTWAKTGQETQQYASLAAREADIEAGASRSAAALGADIASSARAFTDLAGELPPDAWLVDVKMITGRELPAWAVLSQRLFEVQVHHVDLNAGYRPADWPEWFVTGELDRSAGRATGDP